MKYKCGDLNKPCSVREWTTEGNYELSNLTCNKCPSLVEVENKPKQKPDMTDWDNPRVGMDKLEKGLKPKQDEKQSNEDENIICNNCGKFQQFIGEHFDYGNKIYDCEKKQPSEEWGKIESIDRVMRKEDVENTELIGDGLNSIEGQFYCDDGTGTSINLCDGCLNFSEKDTCKYWDDCNIDTNYKHRKVKQPRMNDIQRCDVNTFHSGMYPVKYGKWILVEDYNAKLDEIIAEIENENKKMEGEVLFEFAIEKNESLIGMIKQRLKVSE